RGNTYWYEFVFNKERFRASTRQGNPRIARQIESAHRTSLAKGEVGLREESGTYAAGIHRRRLSTIYRIYVRRKGKNKRRITSTESKSSSTSVRWRTNGSTG